MKSACLSIVRNECDIIEIFVRYHLKYFDHIFIIEHLSKDGTSEILDRLIREGLPLTVDFSEVPFHNQKNEINKKLHEIRNKHKPQVLLPLDADEFVVGDLKKAAHELASPQQTLALTWHNYVPTSLDLSENNVLKRIVYKNKKINYAQHKVLIPGPLLDYKTYVPEGNHELYYENKMIQLVQSKAAHLAHFPIRSIQQFKRKALVNWISKCSNPENKGVPPDWSHWKLFFEKVKKQEICLRDLQHFALGYTVDHEMVDADMVYDPLNVEELSVQYQYDDNKYDSVQALADCAEFLALEFSKLTYTSHNS
jgi:hypothetical protein